MVRPPFLTRNSRVGIVAPGKLISPSAIDRAKTDLESRGYEVILGNHLKNSTHYFSAQDNQRLEDLQTMVNDPTIAAILCARGGYGLTRIIDRIDLSPLKSHPKWIAGFSDVTALHLKLFKEGVESLHSTMPIYYPGDQTSPSTESLQAALRGEPIRINTSHSKANRPGDAAGITIGGNLSLIVDSLGTPTEINTTGCILILEEIDEPVYKVDRMMMQLKRAGKLSTLAGLVIGHFTDIKDTTPSFNQTVEDLILEKIADYEFPVAFNFPSGHAEPNLTWRHGGTARLAVDHTGSRLTY